MASMTTTTMLSAARRALLATRCSAMAPRALSTVAAAHGSAAPVNPALLMTMVNSPISPPAAIIDPFAPRPFVFETGLQITTQMPESTTDLSMECPTGALDEPLLAVKRTYQPSVLRRKRKHGFRSRRLTIGGRKVLKRRFLKGRWRMSL
ncbi:hypothetical protein P43SY_007552 [Pythium insidiosum]|uniref:Large ribosomal subunit protein bL34m n=1 Tax=Pythium insidiosum TaxID=114742 RepID=A0AAD5LVT4_PYTIN|nr:hypothetical protein P43SY_007552 [Pythium insidiosum]KAJ0394402.1 hypothetical protein ATCC90586_009380 [Pythium insidiosum]